MDTFTLGKKESAMPKSRPPYPPELRLRLIELVRAGRNPEELAREFEPSATSIAFGLRCREAGVRPSMGSVGDAWKGQRMPTLMPTARPCGCISCPSQLTGRRRASSTIGTAHPAVLRRSRVAGQSKDTDGASGHGVASSRCNRATR